MQKLYKKVNTLNVPLVGWDSRIPKKIEVFLPSLDNFLFCFVILVKFEIDPVQRFDMRP